MNNFTKGPWTKAANFHQNGSIIAADDSVVARVSNFNCFKDTQANAQLIAAAPDLFRECSEILELFKTKNISTNSKTLDQEIMYSLAQVIKKAQGQR